MRKLLILLSSISLSLSASLHVKDGMGPVALLNSPSGFVILKDNKAQHLGPEQMDKTLRNMDHEQRNRFLLKGGEMSLDLDKDGYFHLKYAPKLKGGGPIMAAALYWITKVCCYTGVAVSAGAVVAGAAASAVATGGASAVPIVAAAGTTAGLLIKGSIATCAATVSAPVTAIVLTGGAVANAASILASSTTAAAAVTGSTAATVTAAGTATVALATGAAGKVGLVAGIEALSSGAWAFGLLFPWF